MQCSRSRLSAIAMIVAAGFIAAACDGVSMSSTTPPSSGTSSSAFATTTYTPAEATVIGQKTDIVVNPAVSAALKHGGIAVTAVAPASARTSLLLPVSAGQIAIATLAGTVDHAGGLVLGHNGKHVTLTNFVINTNTKQLTATVSRRSLPIFDLTLASPNSASGPYRAIVVKVKLTVTFQAARALNSDLGVRTFKTGMKFGIATLTIAYARGHR